MQIPGLEQANYKGPEQLKVPQSKQETKGDIQKDTGAGLRGFHESNLRQRKYQNKISIKDNLLNEMETMRRYWYK